MENIEQLEKAIKTLLVNQGCTILDKSNGLVGKDTDDFIEACGIAVSLMEQELEKMKVGNQKPLIKLVQKDKKKYDDKHYRRRILIQSENIEEVLNILFNEFRRFYGIHNIGELLPWGYEINIHGYILKLNNIISYINDSDERIVEYVKRWYEGVLDKVMDLEKSGHILKISEENFNSFINGNKTFEIGKKVWCYQVGDTLILKEWDGGKYTNRVMKKEITYILGDETGCIKDGFVIMGLE